MPLINGSTPTQVNTTTADNQSLSAVADLPGIGYVVIWQGPGYNPANPAEIGIFGQCFNYAGNKIGNEFVVSTNVGTGTKFDADVIGRDGGNFTVTWTSFDGSSTGVYMKTMFLGGGTVYPEVQVNTTDSGSQELPQIVTLSNGSTAVIWQASGNNPGETGVFARYYDSSQQPLGDQFQVNSSPTGFSSTPSLTATFGAGSVAVWTGAGVNGDSEIYLQFIDHTGARHGGEILVNTAGMGAERNAVITTLTNGTYMVAWDVGQPGVTGTEIYAQRFGLNGEKIGEQIHVTSGDFTGARPAISATPDGGFAITFQSGFQTMLRTYDINGRAGDPWPVAEDVGGLQSRPDIALLGDGSFIASFHNGEIFTERFRVVNNLTEGNDRAMGLSESDYLSGFGGDDILRGGDGDDILEGGLGADRLIGGAGRDEAAYANATSAVSLNLLTGGHTGEAQGDSFEGIEQFSLTRLGDRFIGGDAADTAYGLAGDDILAGGRGYDVLDGGDGNDLLEGGSDGGDLLIGGDGFDEVTYVHDDFGLAIDLAAGRAAGAALADAFISIEKFTLSRFFDEFRGADGVDRVAGGFGNDVLDGRGGNDVLDGNEGNDELTGGAGDDMLNGGSGDDMLLGAAGNDVMAGGTGNDVYRIEEAGDLYLEGRGAGMDALYIALGLGSFTLAAGQEIELVSAIDPASAMTLTLTGNEFGNTLIGTAGSNTLIGGGGNDMLIGGLGNDFYRVENAGDMVFENVGGGMDGVYATLSYTLQAGSEIELLSVIDPSATSAMSLTGNEFANTLMGGAGANVLIGGGGADVLVGGAGNDVYRVETAGDTVLENAGGGMDAVYALTSYTLRAGSEVELLSAIDPNSTQGLNLAGNEFANTLVGTAGADTLTGGGGADLFAFMSALVGGNADSLADFQGGSDRIALDDAVFTGIGATLSPGAFVTGSAAADANDRIVYNQATGQLFYDADGNGAGVAVHFATLAGAPALTVSDFVMI